MIQSQNTLDINEPEFFKESRSIKYKELNEVLKLAEYREQAIILDSVQKNRIALQDSIINSQKKIIDRYKNKVVPNLQSQLALHDLQNKAQQELNEIREEKWKLRYDKLKGRRLGLGVYAGYGYGIEGFQPSIGLGFNYTLFRL